MRDGYYHTGDVATRDADGYITYVGRTDDVFKASDYRISPFELESVLIEHEAVAEAAVVPSRTRCGWRCRRPTSLLAAGPRADAETGAGDPAPSPRAARAVQADPPAGVRRAAQDDLGKIRRVELREAETAGDLGTRNTGEWWEEDLACSDTAPLRDGADSLHDLELDAVFTRSWVIAGSLDRPATSGYHLVSRVAHVPVLVTRARDGALHGFVNVCRHRAYPVATEDGCRQLLQCAYHAWTYELDGRLNRAPRAEAEPGFDRADFSLVRVSVDTWGPLVWINPDPDARPLREAHPELEALAAEHGIDVAGMTLQSRAAETLAANWKATLEGAAEHHKDQDGASQYAAARRCWRDPAPDRARCWSGPPA